MSRLLARAAVLVAATALVAASSLPAFGADTGTINASVTGASPCITIGATSVDFGTAGFSTSSAFSSKVLSNASSYTNCASSSEIVMARGTNAHNAGSTATWSLNPAPGAICSNAATNVYSLTLSSATTPGNGGLDTSNKSFETAAGGATSNLNLGIFMPCTGSAGAGEKMDFQYILTVAF
jgi:hypothetical protein